MGFSFDGIELSLDAEPFRKLYQRLQAECAYLSPFPDWHALLAFFRDQSRGYRRKDRILWRLIQYYQQGGDNERLASFFLLVFKPAILDLHDRGGKRCPQLDDNDLSQEICLILLQIIKESRVTATKVAGKIIGKTKNEVQRMLNDKVSEALAHTLGFDFSLISATTESAAERGDDLAAFLKALNISDTEGLLDYLVQERVITREARKILIETRIKGKSLKDICRPEDVSRLDKRRERAINDARRYIAKVLKL